MIMHSQLTKKRTGTILIGDDSCAYRRIFKLHLKEVGYQVLEACSGHEVFNVLKGKDVDLLLIESMMSDLKGQEILKRVKDNREHQDVPVIFCSTRNKLSYIMHCLKGGATDYIVKPFTQDTLFTKVDKALGYDFFVGSESDTVGLQNPFRGLIKEADDLNQIEEADISIEERIASSMADLSFCYVREGRDEEAECIAHKALYLLEAVLAPDHPHLAAYNEFLANFYFTRGNYQEAEEYCRSSLDIWKNYFGHEHPYMTRKLETYVNLLQKIINCKEADCGE